MHRAVTRSALAAASCFVVTAALILQPASPGEADNRYTVTRSTIAPGVRLIRIRDSLGPREIRMVELRPGNVDASIDAALAGPRFPSYQKPSDMGRQRGALVAINGDFATSGRPVHFFARNGHLVTHGIRPDSNFAVSLDESLVKIDRSAGRATVRVTRSADPSLTGLLGNAARWNSGAPSRGQLAVYTPVGGTVERPPGQACSVRLERRGRPSWTHTGGGIVRRYRVIGRGLCRDAALAPPTGRELVLSARPDTQLGRSIQALRVDDELRVTWTVGPGWVGVTETMGGGPLLLKVRPDGKSVVVAPKPSSGCGDFCSRQPRTGIGVRADGTVLLMVVDGRRSGWSVGMTLVEFAREFKRRGAVWALNLDGGGGTVMWVRGEGIVNRPSSSSGEKVAVCALLVLPGPDLGEPPALRTTAAGTAGALSTAAAALASRSDDDPAAEREAMLDPGSTGGLVDAIAGGAIGDASQLTPELLRVLARYRSVHRTAGDPG